MKLLESPKSMKAKVKSGEIVPYLEIVNSL